MRALLASALLLLATTSVEAAMVVKPISYTVDKTRFAGHLVYDDASKALRPGLVMVPNWMGETESAIERAKEVAASDYVVLVADMYGEGVRPKDAKEARAQVGALYADRASLRARISEAVATLRAQAGKVPLQADRIAAIGFCFGGSTVLELARSGADLAGVVSFMAAFRHRCRRRHIPSRRRYSCSMAPMTRAPRWRISASSTRKWMQLEPIGSSSTSAVPCIASPRPMQTARQAASTTNAPQNAPTA